MAGRGQGEPGGEGVSEAKGRFPVRMHGDRPCGRAIHHPIFMAVPGEGPVCLMHTRDPNKDDREFQQEFERILREAKDGLADFTRFIFPTSDYYNRTFTAECDFSSAMFTQQAQFSFATFTRKIKFDLVAFTYWTDFSEATFAQNASFLLTEFRQNTSFF